MQIKKSISSFFNRSNRNPSNAVEQYPRENKGQSITGSLDTDQHMTLFLNHNDKSNLRLASSDLNQIMFGPLLKNIVHRVHKIPLNSKSSNIMNQIEKGICGFDVEVPAQQHFFSSVVINSDETGNKVILTSDSFGAIKVRNYQTGARIRKFINQNRDYGHYPLLMAPCGKKLVIGFPTGCIKLICIDSGTEFLTLTGHAGSVDVFVISKCGQNLVSAASDGTVRVWDLIEGKQVFVTDAHPGKFRFLEISPCGKMFVSISTDSPARIWSLETGDCLYRLPFYNKDLTALAITPCGKKLIAGSFDGSIKVWNLRLGNGIGYVNTFGETDDGFSPYLKAICAVNMLSCGKKFVTVNYAGVIKIWSLENDIRCISAVRLGERISFFSMSPCGKQFLTMDPNGLNIKVWHMEKVPFVSYS